MQDELVSRLRSFRSIVRTLGVNVTQDYKPFFDPTHKLFFRIPSSPPQNASQVSVTTTATALMALAVSGRFGKVFKGSDSNKQIAIQQLSKLCSADWKSSSLPQNNPFSASIVIRSAGILVREHLIETKDLQSIYRDVDDTDQGTPITEPSRQFHELTLPEIAEKLISGKPEHLGVMQYPPTPAIAYWLVTGALNCGLNKDAIFWKPLGTWLAQTFFHQMSLVTANHTALMDPVSLAMAAATCARLANVNPEVLHSVQPFPTEVEIRKAVNLFMQCQTTAGTWNKYFPLFHYPTAGSNHCWHIEVLEALLQEFPQLLSDLTAFDRFKLSVDWLEANRLTWKNAEAEFSGWNSGGQIETLTRGEPESWATGVAHMFLRTLSTRLDEGISESVLRRYGVTTSPSKKPKKWLSLLDSECKIAEASDCNSVKLCVSNFVINPILEAESDGRKIEELPSKVKRSALLFGPPGTGKTRFVSAVAEVLGWNFVEVTPTDFLVDGIDGVYAAASKLFKDLGDLNRTVVFFDEMDAMLQGRVDEHGKPRLDVQQQFMTTCMLPHLAKLYDANKVLFFFATNYFTSFDKAITRAGRFDMLLFMGPPTWKAKVDALELFVKLDPEQKKSIAEKLLEIIPNDSHNGEVLTKATFAELKSLFRAYCDDNPLEVTIKSDPDLSQLCNLVEKFEESKFSLCIDTTLKAQYETERKLSEVRW